MAENLVATARRAAGLSQYELACRAHTSRPTLSAYEHGRKSPTLDTVVRLLAAAGFELALRRRITFTQHVTSRGRVFDVPDALPRLTLPEAMAVVTLPIGLNWSDPGHRSDLGDRRQRARVYEVVLREGSPADILTYVDGALLADLWPELVLPREIRAAWEPLIQQARGDVA